MGSIDDFRKAGRPLHPATKKTFGIKDTSWLVMLWNKINFKSIGKNSLLVAAIASLLVYVFDKGFIPSPTEIINDATNLIVTDEEVKVVSTPEPTVVIKYIDRVVEVIKYQTKLKVVNVPNPLNEELQEANRILQEKAAALEVRLASFSKQCNIMQKIVDDFYSKPIQKGWGRTLYYKSADSAFLPIDKLP